MFFMNNKENKKNVLPFVEGLTFPLNSVAEHSKVFFLLVSCVSFFVSLFVVLSGHSLYCELSPEIGAYIFCSDSLATSLSALIVTFMGMVFVFNRWQIGLSDKNLGFVDLLRLKCFKKDMKAAAVILLYIGLWVIVSMGIYFLNVRKPTPDWHMELAFFVLVSSIIVFAIILLLNFVVFQHFLQGGSFFALNKTFWIIFDNIYKPISWFFIYFIIFAYITKVLLGVVFNNGLPLWLSVFVSEFFCYFVVYSIIAVFSASLYFQEKKLFIEDK